MIYNDKKWQKKVLRLIMATRKANPVDLELFMALITLRFDLLDDSLENENTHFQNSIYLYKHFKEDTNIVNLLR